MEEMLQYSGLHDKKVLLALSLCANITIITGL